MYKRQLYNGLLNVMLAEELVDRPYIAAHTEGFAALEQIVAAYPPAVVAEICGLAEADIITAARWFGTAGAALSLYCQGLNPVSYTHLDVYKRQSWGISRKRRRPGRPPSCSCPRMKCRYVIS